MKKLSLGNSIVNKTATQLNKQLLTQVNNQVCNKVQNHIFDQFFNNLHWQIYNLTLDEIDQQIEQNLKKQ